MVARIQYRYGDALAPIGCGGHRRTANDHTSRRCSHIALSELRSVEPDMVLMWNDRSTDQNFLLSVGQTRQWSTGLLEGRNRRLPDMPRACVLQS
jgi:hypothetical protein